MADVIVTGDGGSDTGLGAGMILGILIVIVAIAFAIFALVLFVTSPDHDMHQVVSTYHHLPHFLQAFLGAQHLGT